MGKHSTPEQSKAGIKQMLGAFATRSNAGRHSAPKQKTAAGVLGATSAKPVMAAIAIPTAAIGAVTVAGVSSQQGEGQVQVAQNVVPADVSPLAQEKAQAAPKAAKADPAAVSLHTPAPKPAKSSSSSSSSDDASTKGKNGKASGQGGSCTASTYGEGDGTAGGPTASGETFNPSAMTAAHKSLPLGSVVKVTASNGKSVTVRINDRGPYVSGRCLDLSTAAMNKIGGDGVIKVSYKVL
ncbi:septal ring lytic transglycosylase RlpA family protein [Brevibacterium sp. 91QC2O2]|uniref:septal ring lytic transglycosylase RlpA family protein n=1 Tax=Brevibacterium sp. 91QC2O2 TaxID=2968458 RepID=UPI00359CB1B0